jgi:hypothetical protein
LHLIRYKFRHIIFSFLLWKLSVVLDSNGRPVSIYLYIMYTLVIIANLSFSFYVKSGVSTQSTLNIDDNFSTQLERKFLSLVPWNFLVDLDRNFLAVPPLLIVGLVVLLHLKCGLVQRKMSNYWRRKYGNKNLFLFWAWQVTN